MRSSYGMVAKPLRIPKDNRRLRQQAAGSGADDGPHRKNEQGKETVGPQATATDGSQREREGERKREKREERKSKRHPLPVGASASASVTIVVAYGIVVANAVVIGFSDTAVAIVAIARH